ncbi:PR5-like receptor kinase [Quercus robur]|uniref:PR5-like receptor kinase n=1 Tax=Quercus robur TaxID=38942 RepID=UPI002161A150|nr:PR5-like receptor kinase [Quercus robur]
MFHRGTQEVFKYNFKIIFLPLCNEYYIFSAGPASRTKILKLIIGVAASVVGVLLTCIIIFWFRSKRSIIKSTKFWTKKTKNEQDLEAFIRKYGPLALNRYKFLELKKMTNSFRDKLGQGGFGGVYKGKLLDGRPVAVKVLNESKGNGEEFINEVASISRTSHVNIVTLVGFCLEGQKRALIYEFMPNGSLEKFIQDGNLEKTNLHLGWEKLFQIAIGIARGLEYLHRGCNTRILHFDIKPHNILLDEDFCPKISDFGLAKLCIRNESNISMTGTRGTIGYIAPEVFSRNFGGVSHKSDVYSYGMMILEMAGGRNNTDVGVSQTSEIYFPHWIYKRLELDNDIGFLSNMTTTENEMVRKMILVGLWCIQTNPSDRPSMNKVIEMIEGNIEALKIPPKPFLCSPPRSLVEESSTTSML